MARPRKPKTRTGEYSPSSPTKPPKLLQLPDPIATRLLWTRQMLRESLAVLETAYDDLRDYQRRNRH
jgi:hypothetical protein